MQGPRLLDAGRSSRLVNQTMELPGRHRLSWLAAREQPALLLRHARIVTSRSHLPPLPQQIERLWRQHDVAVFAIKRYGTPHISQVYWCEAYAKWADTAGAGTPDRAGQE